MLTRLTVRYSYYLRWLSVMRPVVGKGLEPDAEPLSKPFGIAVLDQEKERINVPKGRIEMVVLRVLYSLELRAL